MQEAKKFAVPKYKFFVLFRGMVVENKIEYI